MPAYNDSPELAAIGAKLIAANHQDLVGINIGYLFRDQAPVSRGSITVGMVVRVDDRNHVYSGKDVIIEIGADVWEKLDDECREVVMDHELCHIGVSLDDQGHTELTPTGRAKVHLKMHDVEEFQSVMDRAPEAVRRLRKTVEGLSSANTGASQS